MKKSLLIFIALLMSGAVFAQVPAGNQPQAARKATAPPLAVRQVSGIVKDSTDNTIPGAVVKLESAKDTITISTNVDGIFIIKNVKSNVFVVTVSSVGYTPIIKKFSYNDATPRLTLDPFVMRSSNKMLKTVTINGTPSITYKPDTVEYRASDYKVHENATVDELLKKMEGMEVGTDGTLTHQGQQVMKARLNGKDYAGGDVAQAIQNLPADIVEKIQIVDDYGEQAARTGVKDGDPQKVLNITTRADRSVGTTGRVTAQYGNDDRYNAQVFAQRIDANQQLGVIANFRNTVNGVASSGLYTGGNGGGNGGGGGNPGTTKSGQPSINYRDQWGKKIQVVASYGYNYNDNNSINQSYGFNKSTLGTNNFHNNNTSEINRHGHNIRMQMDYTIDSANFLQFTPTYSYNNTNQNINSNVTNAFDYSSPEIDRGISNSLAITPNFNLNALYVHVFKKPRRNFSVQFTLASSRNQSDGDKNNSYIYYADSTFAPPPIKDSVSHLLTNQLNHNTTYGYVASYSEPLGKFGQLELVARIRHADNSNTAISDSVLADGSLKQLHRLDNIFDYSTTEQRYQLSYHYNGTKVNFSIGGTLVPYNISGTKINDSNSESVLTSRSYSRLIPVLHFRYNWSRTEQITLNYTGTNNDPPFNYIQPFIDETDINNVKVGNPNLKPSFTNELVLQYNNYLPNPRINISFNLNGSLTDNQFVTNALQFQKQIGTDPISGKPQYRTVDTIYYQNVSGAKTITGRYNLSKQLDDRRYNFALNGSITYNYSVAASNNIVFHNTNWVFNQRFGPRINPNDNIEINPYVAYVLSRGFTVLPQLNRNTNKYEPTTTATEIQSTALAIDGKFYFFKTFQLNYSATKSFVTGYGNLGNPSPLVINAGFEKEFFARKNLILTFNVYDILHQNNFIQQSITAQSTTYTLSNALSRYFLLGFRLNLQKWSGKPTRNGRTLQRRGDGSFIY